MTEKAKIGLETSRVKETAVEFDEQLLSHMRCNRNVEAKLVITRGLATASDGFGTLLHYAATYGNATITRHSIELGCEIDVPGRDGKTPLMLAVSGGRTAAMKVLLSADADIDITDDDGQSALQAALTRDYVSNEIVKSFVRKLQTTSRTTTELAQRLIAAGGNMYHASTLVDVELLEYLLGLGVDIDSRGANGATALHVAAESNHHRVASWLIENGADVNALDIRGNCALHVCAKNGSKDLVKILLERGADFDLTGRRDGRTPVDAAMKNVYSGERFFECLKLFHERGAKTTILEFDELLPKIAEGHCFTKFQVDENSLEKFDDVGTLLHHAARCNNLNAAKLLIELGSKVDSLVAGRTPLMLAAQHGLASMVEVLLRANANVDLEDDAGRSALEMALESDYYVGVVRVFIRERLANGRTSDEIAGILIDAGANMYHAVCLEDVELMERMIERGIDVDSRGHRGRTGLHETAQRNYAILSEWLIARGADVNAIGDLGQSPLIVAAASNRCKDTLKILLKSGADPNLKNTFGATPLFVFFLSNGSRSNRTEGVEFLELLLQHGAIPQNSMLHGTIFDYALDRSNDEEIQALIGHLAILEMRGVTIAESVVRCDFPKHRSKVAELENFHATSLRELETPIFDRWSLFDLLNGSESKLEMMANNEEFVSEARKVCMSGKMNSYYRRRAMERIDEASRIAMLKNGAIRVICKLFDGNYDKGYIFARGVINFLDVTDLETLVMITQA